MRTLIPGLQALALGVSLLLALPVAAQKLDQAIAAEERMNRESKQSQQRIDRISDETQSLFEEYRQTNARIDTLRVYNRQLATLIASQEAEIASLSTQIEEVSSIEREIMPLMEEMIGAIEVFVENDVPFLLEERRTRVENLRELMDRSDVSVAEKYRKIMEAWQIENDYGRAVDTYRGTLDVGGETKTVDFLKIGRVAFLYLTLDDSEARVWDQGSRQWLPANGYRSAIRQGLKMANKQVAVDLLTLPMPAPDRFASEVGRQAQADGAQGVGE